MNLYTGLANNPSSRDDPFGTSPRAYQATADGGTSSGNAGELRVSGGDAERSVSLAVPHYELSSPWLTIPQETAAPLPRLGYPAPSRLYLGGKPFDDWIQTGLVETGVSFLRALAGAPRLELGPNWVVGQAPPRRSSSTESSHSCSWLQSRAPPSGPTPWWSSPRSSPATWSERASNKG